VFPHLSPDVVDQLDLAVVVQIQLLCYCIKVKVVAGLHVLEGDVKVSRGALAEEAVGGA
jgi:hypothetical protein